MAGHGEPEKPIISPEDFLRGQGVAVDRQRFCKALIAFMSVSEMATKFRGRITQEWVFSHTREPFHVRDDGTILVGQVYGGPYCSIVLEELAVSGVKHAVGYGFSGTLDENIAPGALMVAESGFCSDGTSKEYTSDTEVYADSAMLLSLQNIMRNRGINYETGKVWTTDALYREFPAKVASWKRSGARFVNLETSPFYAVARSTGMKAVYLSVVSDTVHRDRWSGWPADLEDAIASMWDISLAMIDQL